MRRLTFRSTSVVSSRGVIWSERTASETIAIPPMSSFWMTGSWIPAGRSLRMAEIFERASCAASLILTSRLNSTMTVESPSRDVE